MAVSPAIEHDLLVSEMAASLVGSEIIRLAAEIKERKSRGEQIHNLTIGDFDPEVFPIPEELARLIVAELNSGSTNYPAANGQQALREAVAAFLQRTQQLTYSPAEILVAGGARPLIYAVYQCVLDPGDTVVYPVPSWNNNHYTHLSRANGIAVETTYETNFMPTASQLEPHLHGARLLALCSPLNPTGTVFSAGQLRDVCRLVLAENQRRTPGERPLYLLYDQIYSQLCFGDAQHVDPVSLDPAMRPYTLYIDGISKSMAATGIRVGWAFGPQPVIDRMKSILGHVGAWAPKAEQEAVARFLNNQQETNAFLTAFRAQLNNRLEALYQGFETMRQKGLPVKAVVPQGAIYLTVQFDLRGRRTPAGTVLSTMAEVSQYLLTQAHVAVVPFSSFGSPGDNPWYRLSVGTLSQNAVDGVLRDVEKALSQLI